MSDDFVTRLQLQLREAALREERRTPVALRAARARRALPGPGPMAATLAAALVALVVAIGALSLRGEPEPAAPRVIATFHVAGGLASLSAGFGSVWTVDYTRGQILRVDPATRRVLARIPVGGGARVDAGAGAVWALAGDLLYAGDQGPVRLLRIDPAADRVTARIPMRTPAGGAFGPLDVRVARGGVWVVGAAGALRVDPSRDVADRFVPLGEATGEAARGAVTDGESVWTLSVDGRLRRLDARTGLPESEARVRVTAGSHLFPGAPGTLTVTGDDEIAVVERASGRELWRTTLGGEVRHWMSDGDSLWAYVSGGPAGRDRLVRLDAGSGRRLGQVDLPEPDVAGMAKVGRDVWVATPGGKIVVVR
jgi:hypothetical protein